MPLLFIMFIWFIKITTYLIQIITAILLCIILYIPLIIRYFYFKVTSNSATVLNPNADEFEAKVEVAGSVSSPCCELHPPQPHSSNFSCPLAAEGRYAYVILTMVTMPKI